MLCRMKANGSGVDRVTVRAVSSAFAVSPSGTTTPYAGDLTAGSVRCATFAATVLAVTGLPSAQVTPRRRVKVTEVGPTSHFSASPETIRPSGPAWTRVSYASDSAVYVVVF